MKELIGNLQEIAEELHDKGEDNKASQVLLAANVMMHQALEIEELRCYTDRRRAAVLKLISEYDKERK